MTTLVPSRPSPATADRPDGPVPSTDAIAVERLNRGRTGRLHVPRPVSRLTGVVLAVGLWQLLSSTGTLPATIVGSPLAVARAAGHLVADGELGSAIGVSLVRVAEGVGIGLVAGTVLAVVAGLSRIGEDVVDAPVQMLRTIPFAGLIPLLIIWLGVGEAPKVVLIALGVTFPVYINLAGGIRSVDPGLLEAGRTLGLSRWQRVWHVVLPSALPQLLVGIRLALGISWLALVFAEQISATDGLGYLMMTAQELLQTDTIVVCLVVYALLGLLVDLLVRGLERVLLALASAVGDGVTAPHTVAPTVAAPPAVVPAVSLRGVGRRFGDQVVLEDLDLEIAPGEFVALLGHSGCGKSTLLRIVAGLDSGSSGEAVVAVRRAVAFQSPRLLPWKRVWRNVVLGLDHGGRAEALAALAEVRLEHRADAWPATLSGGEAQRASLARALVREPDLLLLDEPFGALDALTRLTAQGLVADLWARRRPAVLLVTHDVDEAIRLADRVLVMDHGRIEHDIPVDLPRPRDLDDHRYVVLRRRLLGDLGVEA